MKNVLTVLLLTYNHAPWIERCIKSVLEQKTDFPFQIWIADDASTDGTSDIVRKYAALDSRITPFIQKENTKGTHFLDRLAAVDTEFFTVIEGDDFWCDSEKLQLQVDALKRHPNCSMCTCNTMVYEKGVPKKPLKRPLRFGRKEKEFGFWHAFYTHTASRVYRSALFPLNDKEKMSFIAWDDAMRFYALDKGKMIYLNRIMSVYNMTGSGAFSSMSLEERAISAMQANLRLDRFFNGKYSKYFHKHYPYPREKYLFKLTLPYSRTGRIQFAVKKYKTEN